MGESILFYTIRVLVSGGNRDWQPPQGGDLRERDRLLAAEAV